MSSLWVNQKIGQEKDVLGSDKMWGEATDVSGTKCGSLYYVSAQGIYEIELEMEHISDIEWSDNVFWRGLREGEILV